MPAVCGTAPRPSDTGGVSGHPVFFTLSFPPALAGWLRDLGESGAVHVEDLGLPEAEDPEIFEKARQVNAVVITKDNDFVKILEHRGPPPRVVWVTCGNRSNPALKNLFVRSWSRVKALLEAGEDLIEINQIRNSAEYRA